MLKVFYSLVFLAVLFSISHFIFEPTYLYYELWWLDIPMHILGGFGLGVLAYTWTSYTKQKFTLKKVLMLVLLVATAWEIYEYAIGNIPYTSFSDYVDTCKDYVDAIIGAWLSYIIVKKS